MRVLELFSGSGTIAKAFRERGYEVITIDNEKKFNPDIVMDILNINSEILRNIGKIDIIWASPPCTSFSVASISSNWTGGFRAYIPKTEKARLGIKLVDKTNEIIFNIKPKYWFIENPRGVLRKLNIINGKRNTLTYCQYGDNRMKPTDIWTNCETWIPKNMCKNGDKCHVSAPRGSSTGTQGLKNAYERGIIPIELAREIVLSCERGFL